MNEVDKICEAIDALSDEDDGIVPFALGAFVVAMGTVKIEEVPDEEAKAMKAWCIELHTNLILAKLLVLGKVQARLNKDGELGWSER